MELLSNYVCAFYPWCLFAIPLVIGMVIGIISHRERKTVGQLSEDEIGGSIAAGLVISVTMPFWPVLILCPIAYFLVKTVLNNVSITKKSDDSVSG